MEYKKAFELVKSFDKGASPLPGGGISLKGVLASEEINIEIYYEPVNFQINIGDLTILDKVEQEEVMFEEIEGFLHNFMQNYTNKGIEITISTLFGRKACEVSFKNEPSIPHFQYDTAAAGIVKRFGKRSTPILLLPR